jgi:hypothetical protein
MTSNILIIYAAIMLLTGIAIILVTYLNTKKDNNDEI